MGSRYFHVLLWLPVYMYMVQLVQSGVSRYHHYLSDGNYKGVFWRRMDIIEYTPHLVWVKKVINQCMGVYLAKMGVHQPADLVIFLESATYDHTTAAVSGCHIWGLCIRESSFSLLFCFSFFPFVTKNNNEPTQLTIRWGKKMQSHLTHPTFFLSHSLHISAQSMTHHRLVQLILKRKKNLNHTILLF